MAPPLLGTAEHIFVRGGGGGGGGLKLMTAGGVNLKQKSLGLGF